MTESNLIRLKIIVERLQPPSLSLANGREAFRRSFRARSGQHVPQADDAGGTGFAQGREGTTVPVRNLALGGLVAAEESHLSFGCHDSGGGGSST